MTLDNRNKRPHEALTPAELEEKRKQAERLGLPVKGTKLAAEIESLGKSLASAEEEERRQQRAARFGTTVAATSEDEEKKRRRMERFAKK